MKVYEMTWKEFFVVVANHGAQAVGNYSAFEEMIDATLAKKIFLANSISMTLHVL